MLATLREGTWLTRERARIYCLMLLAAYVLATIALLVSARGLLDYQDRPLGTDFAQVYASGALVLDGHPELPFHNDAEFARQRVIFGENTAIFTWGYPPFFLAVAALLACFPYLVALFLWQGSTLAAYVLAMRRILPMPNALLPILAFPAVYVNFGHGQTGFAVAALFGGAMLLLERRPVLAGILIGLMAFKPQLGLLAPFALLAGGFWRAIIGAVLTFSFLVVASWIGFGAESWRAFFDALPELRLHGLEFSNTGFHKMQSLFAAVRLLGCPVPLAYALHGALVLGLAAAITILWRSKARMNLKCGALIVASFLATPYGFDYDMVLLGPAIAFLVADGTQRGFLPWEKSLLALAWFTPIIARGVAELSFVPFGLLVTLLLLTLFLRRASTREDLAPSQSPAF